MTGFKTTRRHFLAGTAAVSGAAMLAGRGLPAFAQSFPSRNIDVVIPTREGGGADRLYRSFTSIWKKYLKVDFEVGFFPGASGAVGYEVYVGKREPDGHNLLFGNMGPELAVMVVQNATYSFPDDFQYFAHVDIDPSVLYVRADSPFKTVDDVIAEAKKRTLSVATSRLPHPASIGMLLLADHTGAQVNLIPLSGGRNTIAGVVTGETDLGVLPSGSVAGAGEAVRSLAVWGDKNPLPKQLNNAPTVNEHFGTSFPALVSARAFAIHTRAITEYPERFELLQNTAKQTFDDAAWPEAAKKAGQPVELLSYGDLGACNKLAQGMIELAERYEGLLSGK
jgi:tripartite-type tricarboxylate transporter receptor subunit TctC